MLSALLVVTESEYALFVEPWPLAMTAKPQIKSIHRLNACDLIWRTCDHECLSESDYQSLIGHISEELAQGKLVIMRRKDNEIEVTARK